MCASRLVNVPEDVQAWAEGREARSKGRVPRVVGFVGEVEDVMRRAVCDRLHVTFFSIFYKQNKLGSLQDVG
jgi:hypothetical protein